MKVAGSTALVTGANRGLGLAFAKALVGGRRRSTPRRAIRRPLP
jgi:NAD(P)-dependent dehydrogenase (short-subunit alcohol dehydrogenase family)